MNNNKKVVYVLNISNFDLDTTYSVGVYSNIDLAMKKILDSVSEDMISFNTLLSLSKIAFSDNKDSQYSKDIVDSATNILKLVVKNSLEARSAEAELDDDDISEELFLKIQHLIPNPNQYEPQDLYEEFLFYISCWTQLFQQYNVTCDSVEHIQSKIKQMEDGYQKLFIVKESPDFDNINFTLEQLKQRYPNISFNQYSFNNNEFNFSINDYWNIESKYDSYSIVRFVLDD